MGRPTVPSHVRAARRRVQLLAEAHDELEYVQQLLKDIDLRNVRGELRDYIRDSRGAVDEALTACGRAARADIPESLAS